MQRDHTCPAEFCENGGVCVPSERPGSNTPFPSCLCPAGLTGMSCVTPVASCSDQPCRNGGVCVQDGASGFTCRCEGTGFAGRYCEEEPSECQECQNGGTCIPLPGGGRMCDCSNGFTGSDCSERNFGATSRSAVSLKE